VLVEIRFGNNGIYGLTLPPLPTQPLVQYICAVHSHDIALFVSSDVACFSIARLGVSHLRPPDGPNKFFRASIRPEPSREGHSRPSRILHPDFIPLRLDCYSSQRLPNGDKVASPNSEENRMGVASTVCAGICALDCPSPAVDGKEKV